MKWQRLMRFLLIVAMVAILPRETAFAQILLDGEWSPQYHEDQPERIPGPELVDYLGLPINDAARQRAESWDASRLTLPEEQCRVHVSPYIYRGPLDLRIWQEKDPETQQVIAIRNYISTWSQFRTIWMDGRPHPPDLRSPHLDGIFHRQMGGRRSHRHDDAYQDRLGTAQWRSDERPGDHDRTLHSPWRLLTHVMILHDPAYLTEPLIKSEDFMINLHDSDASWVYHCRSAEEITNRPKGAVPHISLARTLFCGSLPTAIGFPGMPRSGARRRCIPNIART